MLRKYRYPSHGIALVFALALVIPGMSSASAMHASAKPIQLKGTIKIGQITSPTGAYGVYGVMQVEGFQAGLAYGTGGTLKVDGAPIKVTQYSDVGTSGLPDPTVAVTKAKQALEQDKVNILQCCASSASALAVGKLMPSYQKILMAAPAADDGLTGLNRYTFRTSREDSQDAITGAAYAYHHFGSTYMTMAQDYAFGQNQEAVWNDQLKKLGARNKGNILFPLTATDFTPYIQKVLAAKPNWLFVACAGLQCTSMFKQLSDSGLLDQVHVMTGLPNVAAIPSFGSAGTKMGFISVYYYAFPHTKANTYLKSYIQKHFHRPADIFDQDSFAAAQQIVAAIKKARSLNTAKLITALEGQTVQGPKGPYTIRKADHLCLQPMYVAKLVSKGSNLVPQLLATKSAKSTAPPAVHNW